MEKKQTAVEWVEKQLNLVREKGDDLIWQYAMQMEKELIEDACNAGLSGIPRSAKQYYNETFGDE